MLKTDIINPDLSTLIIGHHDLRCHLII